jgi:hypothetical protein
MLCLLRRLRALRLDQDQQIGSHPAGYSVAFADSG